MKALGGGDAHRAPIARKFSRRFQRGDLTLAEAGCLGIIGILLIVLLVVFLPRVSRQHEESRKVGCKSNLRSIGVAMVVYVDNFGTGMDGIYYAYRSTGGVPTLSLLYSPGCRLLVDPRGWVCPSTKDPLCSNTTLDYSTCSYIGRMPEWGVLSDSAASDTRVAADDSYAAAGNNHVGGCNVLFLDGHVEFITASGNPTAPPLSATKY